MVVIGVCKAVSVMPQHAKIAPGELWTLANTEHGQFCSFWSFYLSLVQTCLHDTVRYETIIDLVLLHVHVVYYFARVEDL